jgi:hypothetical protein
MRRDGHQDDKMKTVLAVLERMEMDRMLLGEDSEKTMRSTLLKI